MNRLIVLALALLAAGCPARECPPGPGDCLPLSSTGTDFRRAEPTKPTDAPLFRSIVASDYQMIEPAVRGPVTFRLTGKNDTILVIETQDCAGDVILANYFALGRIHQLAAIGITHIICTDGTSASERPIPIGDILAGHRSQ